MIHLLFRNTLYPNIDRAAKIEVVSLEKKKYPYIAIYAPQYPKTLILDVCSHPNVLELINKAEGRNKYEVAKDIVYKTFYLFCERFTGKTFLDGKLINIENALFNVDAALFSMYKVEDETENIDEIKQ